MRLILSWILVTTFLPSPWLPAQQEALLLKILTEVQRSSRPPAEPPVEEQEPAPLFEEAMEQEQVPWEEARDEGTEARKNEGKGFNR